MDYTGSGKFATFHGIAYVKPPIGIRRFKVRELVKPWYGYRDPSMSDTLPLHYRFVARRSLGYNNGLYLDIYTEEINQPKVRPVMVFIHGGEFDHILNSSIYYGPDYIVDKDVVLVIINYRLGAFGFLNMENEMGPGNRGFKDALTALRWVQDNISHFGGDPGNVTIFGKGFGGSMVYNLAMCSQADGLYHKAISQCDTGEYTWAFSDKEAQRAQCFVVKIRGSQTTDPEEALNYVKSIDANDSVEAFQDILTTIEKLQHIFPFDPIEDYDSKKQYFLEYLTTLVTTLPRCGFEVPFIVNSITSKSGIFVGYFDERGLEQMYSNFESIIHPSKLATLKKKSLTAADLSNHYFGNELVSMKTISKYINFLGDMHFYRGAIHNEEMSSIFRFPMSEALRSEIGLSWIADPERRMFRECMAQIWTDFAKTGDPTLALTPLIPIKWTPLESEEEFNFVIIITKNCKMQIVKKKKLRFLAKL